MKTKGTSIAMSGFAEELIETRKEIGESHDFKERNSDFHGVVA